MSEHKHQHHDENISHIHSHRNLIGFDEHGIPVVTLKASHHGGEEDDSPQAFIKDYMNAVSAGGAASCPAVFMCNTLSAAM